MSLIPVPDGPSTADPIDNTLSFDMDGLIESGLLVNPAPLQYNVFFFEFYLSHVLSLGGYGAQAAAMERWFPDATYHVGLSSIVSVSLETGGIGLELLADNLIETGNGRDVILDLAGDNLILAGGAADVIVTGSGCDVISGGKGNDLVMSGAGDDFVEGDGGRDTLLLGAGDDLATGGRGADLLMGEAGEDWLWGNNGFDVLDGGTGNDRLEGGWGCDTFRFMAGTGRDIVTDFQAGRDRIELDMALGASDFETLLSLARETPSGGVTFELAFGDAVTLENTALVALRAEDFVFV
ncbi:MAG: calcium-binding protein [Pseudomonadota bacterium]